MRRLHTRRAGGRAESALEGLPRMQLEGDATDAPADEGPLLRPFAAALPCHAVPPERPPPALPAAQGFMQQALEYERLGRRLDAVAVLEEALAADEHNHEARIRLAQLLEAGSDTEQALELLERGLKISPGQAALLIQRGIVLGRLGRHMDAEADLRAAIAANPANPAAHLHLGIVLLRRGRHAEAIPALLRAASLEPAGAEVQYHLGEAYFAMGQLDQAEPMLRRAGSLAPHDPRAWKLLGRLLDRTGRTEEAMAMHRRAREAGPE